MLLSKNMKKIVSLIILIASVHFFEVSAIYAQNPKDTTENKTSLNNKYSIKVDSLLSYNQFIQPIKQVFNHGAAWAQKFEPYRLVFIYFILSLSVALFIVRKVRKKRGEVPLEGSLHIANWILLLLISLAEIFYILSLGSSATWFCVPDQMGWTWTSINFVIFGLVVFNQLLSYMNILRDLQYNSYTEFNWNLGLYAWPAFLALAILSSIFFEPGIFIAIVLLALIQIIQIVVIFIKVIPKGGVGHAILCSTVYLFGAVAATLVLIHFVILLIIVLFALVVAYFFLGALGGSSSGGVGDFCPKCGRKLDFSKNCHHCNTHYY